MPEEKYHFQDVEDYQKTHNIMDVVIDCNNSQEFFEVKVYPNFDSLNLEKTWFTVNLRVYNQ